MNQEYDEFLFKLKSIIDNASYYPAAVSGTGKDDYKERDDFKNGWNAGVEDITGKIDHILDDSHKFSESEKLFLASGVYYTFIYEDGNWSVFLNDQWYYACADGEDIPKEKYDEVASWYRKYGDAGVMYWVYLQRKHFPTIPKTRKQVELILELENWNSVQYKQNVKKNIKYILFNKVNLNQSRLDIVRETFDKYIEFYKICPYSWEEFREYVYYKLTKNPFIKLRKLISKFIVSKLHKYAYE